VNQAFNAQAPKKPANVSINVDKSKALKANLSATLENALIDLVNTKQRELWKQQNQDGIDSYNLLVVENGVFGDDLRGF
jgi:antitoxin CcdA